MPKFKKSILRIFLVFIILIPVAAFAHFIIFPQETRSILVGFSSLKKDGRIYYDKHTSPSTIDSLKSLISQAAVRVENFWGGKAIEPKFIYCDNEALFEKYSVSPAAPAATYLKLGSVIVLSPNGLNLDIVAHEISHAALFEKIGFYNFTFKIPAWFKHGIAMQNDYRDYYSDSTLALRSDHFKNMPDKFSISTDQQFYSGNRDQIMLNYMTAKHIVKNWYTKEKLDSFIQNMNEGKSFEEAYGQ